MNIQGGSKSRIDIKKRRLANELRKPNHEQDKRRIRQLKDSIKRNKKISKHISHRTRRKNRKFCKKK